MDSPAHASNGPLTRVLGATSVLLLLGLCIAGQQETSWQQNFGVQVSTTTQTPPSALPHLATPGRSTDASLPYLNAAQQRSSNTRLDFTTGTVTPEVSQIQSETAPSAIRTVFSSGAFGQVMSWGFGAVLLGKAFTRSKTALGDASRPLYHNMVPNDLTVQEYWSVIGIGFAFTFVAGFINAVSLVSALKLTVSHVTGATTKGALGLLGGTWGGLAALMANMGCFLAFIFGSFVSGMTVTGGAWQLGKGYGIALLIEAASIFLGYQLYFTQAVWVAMPLNAFACGIQNALTTQYSGALIRTTHVTGAATDIGTALADVVRRGKDAASGFKLKYLLLLVAGYFAGGMAGGTLWTSFGYASILLPSAMVAVMGLSYMFVRNNQTAEQLPAAGLAPA